MTTFTTLFAFSSIYRQPSSPLRLRMRWARFGPCLIRPILHHLPQGLRIFGRHCSGTSGRHSFLDLDLFRSCFARTAIFTFGNPFGFGFLYACACVFARFTTGDRKIIQTCLTACKLGFGRPESEEWDMRLESWDRVEIEKPCEGRRAGRLERDVPSIDDIGDPARNRSGA